jgi:hypothetical protein
MKVRFSKVFEDPEDVPAIWWVWFVFCTLISLSVVGLIFWAATKVVMFITK